MSVIIRLEDETDRWQWVCPNGHRSWEPTNSHFWCVSCARHTDADGDFGQLRNKSTGEVHDREELRLVTPAGPYQDLRSDHEDDLDRGRGVETDGGEGPERTLSDAVPGQTLEINGERFTVVSEEDFRFAPENHMFPEDDAFVFLKSMDNQFAQVCGSSPILETPSGGEQVRSVEDVTPDWKAETIDGGVR